MKECKYCSKIKSLDNFYKYLDKEARCKECVSDLRRQEYQIKKDLKLKAVQNYRKANPEKIRDTKLRQAYGVGLDYFNTKLTEQGGVCAGCKRNVKTIWRGKAVAMALDHNHETKAVRGVLCLKCNRGLGLLEENEQTFLNLINYMNKYKK